jgi:hypothetical protein
MEKLVSTEAVEVFLRTWHLEFFDPESFATSWGRLSISFPVGIQEPDRPHQVAEKGGETWGAVYQDRAPHSRQIPFPIRGISAHIFLHTGQRRRRQPGERLWAQG